MSFDREVSVLAVRSRDAEVRCWPLVENHHRDGILRASFAPAPDAAGLQATAEAYVRALLERLEYVGVLAIELFQVGETLLGNEMAPRVHNSGHWTIEGAETSQFENHLRAICGLPLGATDVRGQVAMLNLIGEEPEAAGVLAVPGAHSTETYLSGAEDSTPRGFYRMATDKGKTSTPVRRGAVN